MTSITPECPQCGKANPYHRIWCAACEAPLPYAIELPQPENPQPLAEKKKLYQKILTDLEQLQNAHQIAPATHSTIETFYRHQLEAMEQAAAEQARVQTVHQFVVGARLSAHRGRYQHAIALLQQAVSSNRGIYPLDHVIAEVTAKINAQDKAAQRSRRAQQLLRESRQDIAVMRLEAARAKLAQAKQLDPASVEIGAALQQVETDIREQSSRERPQREHTQAPDEEIVVATVVQEPGIVREITVDSPLAPAGRGQGEGVGNSRTMPSEALVDNNQSPLELVPVPGPEITEPRQPHLVAASFADDTDDPPSPTQRLIDAASQWSAVIKPFLLDNVGWFVGAFLIVAGFVVLIVTFWGSIEQNRILMHSLVYASLAVAAGTFFSAAYFMRLKYPQLESSSNVLLVIVALLIPLVFAAATLTSLVPASPPDMAIIQNFE